MQLQKAFTDYRASVAKEIKVNFTMCYDDVWEGDVQRINRREAQAMLEGTLTSVNLRLRPPLSSLH